jgi:hypothetical protein
MTPSIKVSCFNLQARKEGRPFRAAPSSDLRAGLAVHLLGPSVGNFLTCSSTWERRCCIAFPSSRRYFGSGGHFWLTMEVALLGAHRRVG